MPQDPFVRRPDHRYRQVMTLRSRLFAGEEPDLRVAVVGQLETTGRYRAHGHRVERPTLHLVVAGRPTFARGGHAKRLGTGNHLVIAPEAPFDQSDDPGTPTRLYWIGLEGLALADLLRRIGLDEECIGDQTSRLQRLVALCEEVLAGPTARVDLPHYDRLLAWQVLDLLDPRPRPSDAITEVLERIREAPPMAPSIASVAVRHHQSRATLHRRFVAATGCAPKACELAERLDRARRMLSGHGDGLVTRVAAACGFHDPAYFARAFRKVYGLSPSAWARGERPGPATDGGATSATA